MRVHLLLITDAVKWLEDEKGKEEGKAWRFQPCVCVCMCVHEDGGLCIVNHCADRLCMCVFVSISLSENQNPSPSVTALHARKAHTLSLPSNSHFSQGRLVSFLTITVSPSLLAGVSTASVSFLNGIARLLKLKAHFFSVSLLGVMGKAGNEGWR